MNTHEYPLAEIIWTASRDDEGTISATGANIVARAILASDWLATHTTRVVEQERERKETYHEQWMLTMSEHNALIAKIEALADEWKWYEAGDISAALRALLAPEKDTRHE